MPEPDHIYRSLKLAAQMFGQPLEALAPAERRRVDRAAARQHDIEALILATPEAAAVLLPEASIDASLAEIRSRYESDEDYYADLERIGLDALALRQAVSRDLVVEAVLEKVAAQSASVSETDVEIFWRMHRQRFRRAETRLLRHILVTINDDLTDNQRQAARSRIDAIRTRLVKEPPRFAEQALKHSECPTAINGGLLGQVPRGQLYPELDAAAFALDEASLSEVVESELGYHLICCERIQPERLLSFAEARPTIRERLEQDQHGRCQKAWIEALRLQAAQRSLD
jgi:peptidyl-prolyl cis-trans isomerase C